MQYLKLKWQQRDSNPQQLSLSMKTQPFRQTDLKGWVFIYKLSGCAFESCCCQLNANSSKHIKSQWNGEMIKEKQSSLIQYSKILSDQYVHLQAKINILLIWDSSSHWLASKWSSMFLWRMTKEKRDGPQCLPWEFENHFNFKQNML